MTRVISVLSKKKEQMLEYKRIENGKFDKKIEKSELKTKSLKEQKAKFNEEIDAEIAKIED